jgi:hypothetical protein
LWIGSDITVFKERATHSPPLAFLLKTLLATTGGSLFRNLLVYTFHWLTNYTVLTIVSWKTLSMVELTGKHHFDAIPASREGR